MGLAVLFLALVCALPALAWAEVPPTCLLIADPTPTQRPVSLDAAPALVVGESEPTLLYAQRAITREMGGSSGNETRYAYVDIPGWRSPNQAAAMSLAVPGAGQLYAGSRRGYVYLGIEALAVYSLAHFGARRDDARADYFAYVGDPNQSASRFAFDRLETTVDPSDVARLRSIYAKDQREFYDAVTSDDRYSTGWQAASNRSDAQSLADETDRLGRRARFGTFVALANHVISAVDALHLARLNNIALRDDLSLRLKLRPGLQKSTYALTLTRRF